MPRHEHVVRRAFTAIEMVAVLFLAALMASLTIASLAGVRHHAEMDEVIDQLRWSNELARQNARRLHAPIQLILDSNRGTIGEQDAVGSDDPAPPRTLYRLPVNYRFARYLMRGGDEAFDPLVISISGTGVSPSYAVQITGPKQKEQWLLVAGLTGQVSRVKDEQQIDNILQSLSPVGNDAH